MSSAPMIERTISHYRLIEELGSGGMGVVYKAEDTKLARHVALKFLPDSIAARPEALERFRREARLASALNHPNICTIHDIDEHDGHLFIVMELLEGSPLSQMIRAAPLAPEVVVDLAIQIADALDAAHTRRIVHRDLKPGNVFVTARGQAKLLDFGVARSTDEPSMPDETTMPHAKALDPLTSPGIAMGTVAYMSPEQARGEPLDGRSDLFSFGAVLYEMLAGRRAFSGGSTAAIFSSLLAEHVPSVLQANRDVPAELGRIVDKALEKRRDLRYQSAADMRTDLRRFHRTESGRVTVMQAPPLRTVAVLPFRDLAGDPANDVWGIGMTDAIIGRLTSLQHLAVRPTTAVLKYVKAPADVDQVARELGVESVLTGTFMRLGDVIRVSAQLVGGSPQATRWAGRFDLRADDMLRFQDDVAQQVVDGMSIPLSPSEQHALAVPMTQSADAHDLYVRARFHWAEFAVRSRRDSLVEGRRLLDEALALDPSFAQAHALRSFLLFYESANFSDGAAEHIVAARESAQRALALAPSLADAWIALGAAFSETGQNEEAIRTLRRGCELAPNSDMAWDLLGYAYHYAGLVEQAEAAYRKARTLNPTSRRLYWLHGRMLLYVNRVDEAIDAMRFALTMDHPKALAHLGKFLYYAGRMEEAERAFAHAAELNADQREPSVPVLGAYLPASRGQRDRVDPWVFTLRPAETFDGDYAYWVGGVYALLGEKRESLAWLRRAVELGNHNYPFFSRDRNYERLRGDEEYESILAGTHQRWERYRRLFGTALLCLLCWVSAAGTCWAQSAQSTRPAPEPPPPAATTVSADFHWGHALKQSGVLLVIQNTLRMAQKKTRVHLGGPFWSDYVYSLEGLHGWDDGNPVVTNYGGHPVMGGITGFIQVQNDPRGIDLTWDPHNPAYWKSRLKGLGWAAAYSTSYELAPWGEAGIGNVGYDRGTMGYVDLVVTPIAGFGVMLLEDFLDARVIARFEQGRGVTTSARILRVILNPSRSVANLVRFQRPSHRDTR